MRKLFELLGLAMIFSLLTLPVAFADEAVAEDEIDAAAKEMQQEGVGQKEDAAMIRTQLRQRLRLRDGEKLGLCQNQDPAECQKRLRKQIRDCVKEGQQQGAIQNSEQAAGVAAALMLHARQDGEVEASGELIRSQMQKKWKAEDIEGAAQVLAQMREQKRWQKQARDMIRECVGDGSCDPKQARLGLEVMQKACSQADLDARDARRALHQELREQKKLGAATGDQTQLRTRLHQRLRIKAQEKTGEAAGTGEQHRYRYRRGQDGENRRGGCYGGGDSGGAGQGIGSGGGGGGQGQGGLDGGSGQGPAGSGSGTGTEGGV